MLGRAARAALSPSHAILGQVELPDVAKVPLVRLERIVEIALYHSWRSAAASDDDHVA